MKKFDKGYFYYSLVSSLFSAVFITFFAFSYFMPDELLKNSKASIIAAIAVSIYIVVYIALTVHAYFYVKTSGYEMTADEIKCKHGLIFKKTSILSFSKIHAVNKRQGIIQKLFNIATLTVDSGATSNAFKAEIIIYEKTEVVDLLVKKIKALQQGEDFNEETQIQQAQQDNNQNLYSFTSKLKVFYSLLTLAGSLFFVLILIVLGAIGLFVATFILRQLTPSSMLEILLISLLISAILLIGLSILSMIGGIIASFIGYHNFTVTKTKSDIEISYGLLVRQTNTFKFSKIKAVKISEGPLKRLFGFASVGLEVVGYGNDFNSDNENQKTANGVLIPLCKRKDLKTVISSILPEYVPEEITSRSKSYPSFIMWPCLIITIIFALALLITEAVLSAASVSVAVMQAIAVWTACAYPLFIAACLLLSLLSYKNAGITISDNKLTAQNGCFIKTTTVIRKKDLIAIEDITTPCRKRRSIYSYKIHFFTNALTNTVTVKNLDGNTANRLEALLRF